jgi:outer membrane protein OmpA-like peptidoglycan-associated protein
MVLLSVLNLHAQQGVGLLGEYFNGINFDYPVFKRIEKKIEFSGRLISPGHGVGKEHYSIRWTGSIYAPKTGLYIFHVIADDGIRLWINKSKIIDGWVDQEATTYSGSIMLEGDQYFDFRMEYYNSIIHSVVGLTWEMPFEQYEIFGRSTALDFHQDSSIPSNYFLPTPLEEKKKPALFVRLDVAETDASKDEPVAKKTEPVTKKIKRVTQAKTDFVTEKPIVLNHVIFEQRMYDIPASAFQELDNVSSYLKSHPKLKIEILGHTDYIGDSLDNQVLSENRARAVAEYLIRKGIEESRVFSKGLGSRHPLVVEDKVNRIANRRVEFVLHD